MSMYCNQSVIIINCDSHESDALELNLNVERFLILTKCDCLFLKRLYAPPSHPVSVGITLNIDFKNADFI